MELTKKDTKMLQGLSVLAMIWLHLFDRGYEGLFQPIVFLRGIPLSFYIAQLSDFCVMGFAFCSGYVHTLMYREEQFYRGRLASLLRLMIRYWVIIALFSAVSIAAGDGARMPGSLSGLSGNLFLYDISYNGAWWYMYAYALLVFLSPVVQRAVKKYHTAIVLTVGFVIYCFGYYLRFGDNIEPNYWFSHIGPFATTVFEYLIGSIFAKEKLFSKIYVFWERFGPWGRISCSAILLTGMLLGHTLVVPSLFVAPFTGVVILILFHFWRKPDLVEKGFLIIGRHSTNLWLTHMFFYLVLFRDFVYVVRYPVAVFLLMILITLCLSCVLEYVEKPILDKIPRFGSVS